MVLGVKKRGHHRVKIKCPVSIRTSSGWIVGETLNLSSTGVLISCAEPLRISELFELVIEADLSDSPLKVTAKVVWSAMHGTDNEYLPHLMGMRFTKISGKERSLISTMVSEHLKQRRIRIVRWEKNHECATERIAPPIRQSILRQFYPE